ncbi:hypothetical protein EVAR_93333_1 [Eumeta japonica]|uniref:Uncharacterized protein n=1 Tax=Eumeta variegata TaxID=151549 RepID=A0A4C1UU77_EUMVA|nr:hypothetical protein EVAR_93333_1 [Eumeta japonica]
MYVEAVRDFLDGKWLFIKPLAFARDYVIDRSRLSTIIPMLFLQPISSSLIPIPSLLLVPKLDFVGTSAFPGIALRLFQLGPHAEHLHLTAITLQAGEGPSNNSRASSEGHSNTGSDLVGARLRSQLFMDRMRCDVNINHLSTYSMEKAKSPAAVRLFPTVIYSHVDGPFDFGAGGTFRLRNM